MCQVLKTCTTIWYFSTKSVFAEFAKQSSPVSLVVQGRGEALALVHNIIM